VTPLGRLFPSGTATSIGSLPHTDPRAAAQLVLDRHRGLPAAPQLPMRAPAESMLAQVAAGLPGIDVYPSGNLRIDASRLSADAVDDAIGTGWPTFDDDGWVGLRAFLAAVGSARRTGPIKVQLAGPVTLALALAQGGVALRDALDIASRAVRARASGLCTFVADTLPAVPVIAFLDEPGLTAVGTDRLPIKGDELADIVSGALAALKPAAATAVHCCGPTDWRIVTLAGPDIVALPASEAVAAGLTIGDFIERGGWVAWGVVPTDGPVGEADRLWRALTSVWCEMTVLGCDPARLRQQSLLTPDCGLAGHGRSQAEGVLSLVARLSRRAEDQALAARLAIGA
jgi:methionine synthase II (cobalamin-independent)